MGKKKEVWRELDWCPILVSNYGRMATVRDPWQDPDKGYVHVQVHLQGKKKHCYLHQLVAEAFLGPCPEDCEIHHKNADKGDNRPENLAYVTRKGHVQISVANGQHARGERQGRSVLKADQVREIRRRYEAGGVTQEELGEEYGVARTTIESVVTRKTWKHIE